MDNKLVLTRRVTTPFLLAVPPEVTHFDAFIYAVVKRRPGKDIKHEKWGVDVRIDPCILNWTQKTITMTIPLDINFGITSFDDLDPHFFEAIEVAFLTLMYSCIP